MRFAVVELASGLVIKTGRNFEKMRDEVEGSSASRWDNLMLIVIPDNYRPTHEEGESYQLEPLEGRVVAVPESRWGYGAHYMEYVNRNRRRLGLPGTFIPSLVTYYALRERLAPFLGSEEALDVVGRTLEGASEEERGGFLEELLEDVDDNPER